MPDSQPTVVFVDPGMMLSFDQLASALRPLGVRTIHLTQSGNPLSRLSSHLVYDRTILFGGTDELPGLLAALPAGIVDVQCPEGMLPEVHAAAHAARLSSPVLALLDERMRWRDKREVGERLLAAGVPAPRQYPVDQAPEPPLVVKQASGSGGEGVRLVMTGAELAQAVADLDGPCGLYVEPFAPGETLCWAGAVGSGRVLDDVVYRTLQGKDVEGPSSAIEVVDDASAHRIGRQVAGLLRTPGLLNLDMVRDAEGRLLVVDVNLRAWHSVVALRQAGHDFAMGYLESLGLAPAGAHRLGVTPRLGRVNVFPDQSDAELERSRCHAVARFARDRAEQAAHLSWRYRVAQTVLFTRRLAARRPGEGGRAS